MASSKWQMASGPHRKTGFRPLSLRHEKKERGAAKYGRAGLCG